MKKFLISLGLLLLIFFTIVVEARRHKHKKSKKHRKQEEIKLLNKHQGNRGAMPHANFRVKVGFVKGTIQTFLKTLKFTDNEIIEGLRVPMKNYAGMMHLLTNLVRQKEVPETAKNMVLLLNPELKGAAKKFEDPIAVRLAINSVKPFIHPNRVIFKSKQEKAAEAAKQRVTPVKRFRRRF